MKEFFLILFFSKAILLTPQSVDIKGRFSVDLSSAVSAVTSGAAIEIDVSGIIKRDRDDEIVEIRRRVRSAIPAGSVNAILRDAKGNLVSLVYQGKTSISRDETYLLLDSTAGVPVGVEFSHIEITSEVPLEGVKVIWRNYSK